MYRLLALMLITLSSAGIVKWIPTTNFNLPTNFEGGKLPCSKQTVVFPDSLDDTLEIEADVSVNGLVLPNDGEIELDSISFFFGPDPNDTCYDDGYIHYYEKTLTAWNQPGAWSSSRFNKATPDAERIPCFDDIVVFPKDKIFTCQLPMEIQTIRELRMGSRVYEDISSMTYDYYYDDETYDLHSFTFIDSYLDTIKVSFKNCKSIAGCPCQDNPMKMDCSVKYCAVPSCVSPIKPIGHCCEICGGVLLFDIAETFVMRSFRELVEKTLSSYEGLVFHIGRVGDKVQLVVVEDGDYDGRSAEAVNEVRYLMDNHWVRSVKETLLSGTPMYKYGLGGKLFVSMFFVVCLVLCMMYGYYYKLPDIRYPVMGRGWFNFGPLARFQRRSDSVVSLTRRDSVVSGLNPLYDSRRDRVLMTESSIED